MKSSRRQFLKTGACLGCLAFTCPTALADTKTDCKTALTDQFLRLQKADMREKADLYRKLVGQFGNPVLEAVKHHVIDQARTRLQQPDVTDRTLGGVMRYLWNHTGDTHRFAVVEQTETQLKLKVTWCFYAEEMRKLNAPDIGLAFYCAYDIGFAEGLNPNIRFSRTRTLMEGHNCCDHTYRLEA